MNREQATELAIRCAAAAQKTHRYLADVLSDPTWKPHDWVVEAVMIAAAQAGAAHRAVQPPAYTEGHCAEKAKPNGCQLHNLQCGYPTCDRKPA